MIDWDGLIERKVLGKFENWREGEKRKKARWDETSLLACFSASAYAYHCGPRTWLFPTISNHLLFELSLVNRVVTTLTILSSPMEA